MDMEKVEEARPQTIQEEIQDEKRAAGPNTGFDPALSTPNTEINNPISPEDDDSSSTVYSGRFQALHEHRHILKRVLWIIICTGFFIPAAVIHKDGNLLVLSLLYGWNVLMFILYFLPNGFITGNCLKGWNWGARMIEKLPRKIVLGIGYGVPPLALILTAVLRPDNVNGTRAQRCISCLGLVVFLFFPWLFSKNRSLIKWKTVWTGITMQFILGLLIIRWPVGYSIFSFISQLAEEFLSFAEQGRAFIFGDKNMDINGTLYPLPSGFATSVLPAIILFAGVIQALYYYNLIQRAVAAMATVVIHIIDISGVECVAACAAPFVGMSEAAMLVGPFVPEMTDAELHQVLTSGFATISGSVFLGLLSYGADATALLTCCMMSVPCAVVLSKMRFPEEHVPLTKGRAVAPAYKDRESNVIHAVANGAIFGIKLSIVIIAVLLVFISLLALADGLLAWLFGFYGVDMSIELLASWILYPVAWLIGIPSQDLSIAAEAMGIKFIVNEFAAFDMFTKQTGLQPRTELLTTYAMASFANPGSIGSQISLMSTLAPGKAGAVAKYSVSACLCGALSTLISACIAGIVS